MFLIFFYHFRCRIQFIPIQYLVLCMSTLCTCCLVTFLATPNRSLRREMYENDVGSYLFHVFSLSSFHPPFSYSLHPSTASTRTSYHLPSTLRRGHCVIRPFDAPCLTLSALDRKSMFFSSRLRSIAVQRQFVSSLQLHRMIVSSLRQDRSV